MKEPSVAFAPSHKQRHQWQRSRVPPFSGDASFSFLDNSSLTSVLVIWYFHRYNVLSKHVVYLLPNAIDEGWSIPTRRHCQPPDRHTHQHPRPQVSLLNLHHWTQKEDGMRLGGVNWLVWNVLMFQSRDQHSLSVKDQVVKIPSAAIYTVSLQSNHSRPCSFIGRAATDNARQMRWL